MNVLETVKKMSPADVWNRVASARIRNHGVYPYVLSEYWQKIREKGEKEVLPPKIIAGLDNSDTIGVFLELLEGDPLKVMQGISITAYALDVKTIVLHIPEYAASLANGLLKMAKEYQIEIVTGMIDPRDFQRNAVHHIAAMADMADLFMETYQNGVYISVNNGELKKVPANLKIRDLAVNAMGEAVKGLELGYQLHGPEALDLAVQEANISNAVVHVLTEQDCVIRLAQERLIASQKLACGKCVFCREGLIQLQEMHKDIGEGKGKQEYIEIMEEIGEAMIGGSLCSMGRQASQIVLSMQRRFYDEYEQHIKKKVCPAGVCFFLKSVYIDPDTCTGCGQCLNVCPQDAILGKTGYIHMIDTLDCTQCGACIDVCDEKSIIVMQNKPPKLPERLTKCGRFKKQGR
jgi:fumarate reductase flavoprotein subunit/NADH-quinone oxidoreductase subunit F